jgi:hypothetical protein
MVLTLIFGVFLRNVYFLNQILFAHIYQSAFCLKKMNKLKLNNVLTKMFNIENYQRNVMKTTDLFKTFPLFPSLVATTCPKKQY